MTLTEKIYKFIYKLNETPDKIIQDEWNKYFINILSNDIDDSYFNKFLKLLTDNFKDIEYDIIIRNFELLINSIINLKFNNNSENCTNLGVILVLIIKNLYENLSINFSIEKLNKQNLMLVKLLLNLNNDIKNYLINNFIEFLENWKDLSLLYEIIYPLFDYYSQENNEKYNKFFLEYFNENIILILEMNLQNETEKKDLILKIEKKFKNEKIKYLIESISKITEYNKQLEEENEEFDDNEFEEGFDLEDFLKNNLELSKNEDLKNMLINSCKDEIINKDNFKDENLNNLNDEELEQEENILSYPPYSLETEEEKIEYLDNVFNTYNDTIKQRKSSKKERIKIKISQNLTKEFDKNLIIEKQINKKIKK